MLTTRIVALLAATLCAGPAWTVPAHASDRPGCIYRVVRVKTHLHVRAWPNGRILDKLYPGDRTWGPCRKTGSWRHIHGTDIGRKGYAYGHYLKKLGRR